MNTKWEVIDQDGNKKIVCMASALFAFTKDTEGYYRILAIKRGSGCPNHVGEWCCPCGCLDYGESLRNAAYRECMEETGMRLLETGMKLFKVNDESTEEGQNITAIFYTNVKNGLDYSFSNKFNEPNEVDKVAWIRLDLLDDYNWAFGHRELILDIWSKRIYMPWWKKILLKLSEKYL